MNHNILKVIMSTKKPRKTTKRKSTRKKKESKQCQLIFNKDLSLNPFKQEHESGVFDKLETRKITPSSLYEDKYFPKSLKEFIGNKDSIKQFKDLLDKKQNRLIIIHGPHGIGKTCLWKLVLQEKYNVIEFNIDNSSEKTVLFDNVSKALNNTSVNKFVETRPRVIVIEDLDKTIGDGVYYNKLLDFISKKTNECMVIGITSNLKKKYKTPTKVDIIELVYPEYSEMEKYAKRIAKNESLSVSDRGIKLLIMSSRFDFRKILQCFKLLSFGVTTQQIKKKDILRVVNFSETDANFSAYEIVEEAFSGDPPVWDDEDSLDRLCGYCYSDQNTIMDLFYSNISGGKMELNEISEILDNIAMGDIFHSEMFGDQKWDLKDYSLIYGCVNPIWITSNRKNKTNSVIKLKKNYLNNYHMTISKNKSIYRSIYENRRINSNFTKMDLQYIVQYIVKPLLESEVEQENLIEDLIKMGINGESYCKLREHKLLQNPPKSLTKTQKNKMLKRFENY